MTCRRCGISVPNDKFPAKVAPVPPKTEKTVPEEAVEVLPRVIHHYPYHTVDPQAQLYPDERLYLSAKRDYEVRTFLAKAALYAAVRHHEQPAGRKDPALARLACVLLLRFAQVYPAYATHFDQPGQPKYFQPADLPPPYRRGYRTAKWEWTASLDVPLNLVIAYALVRDDPALAEAGRQLKEANPSRTIERDLFRASAEFVRRQPEEFSEVSLQAYRGLLAVGRLLDDPVLIREARVRMAEFTARGFYHDGYWRQGESTAHRRVLGQIEGWLDHLLAGTDAAPPAEAAGTSMLALARAAGSASLTAPPSPEVQQVAWPAPTPRAPSRLPVLLGGAGLARLAVGAGDQALDLELRGMGNYGTPYAQRLALRVAVGGRPVLSDLDDRTSHGDRAGTAPPSATTRSSSTGSINARRRPWPARSPPAETSSSTPPTPTSRSRPSTTPRLSAVDRTGGAIPTDRHRGLGGEGSLCGEHLRSLGRAPARPALPRPGRLPGAVAGRRRHDARSGGPPAADDPPPRLGPWPRMAAGSSSPTAISPRWPRPA